MLQFYQELWLQQEILLFCRPSQANAHALMTGLTLRRGGAQSTTYTRLNHRGMYIRQQLFMCYWKYLNAMQMRKAPCLKSSIYNLINAGGKTKLCMCWVFVSCLWNSVLWRRWVAEYVLNEHTWDSGVLQLPYLSILFKTHIILVSTRPNGFNPNLPNLWCFHCYRSIKK